jgi:dihydrofolate reductase
MATPLLRYQVAASLDGFIAPLDGSADWLSGYGAGDYHRFIATIGGIIMGRRGYETELTMGDWAYDQLPVMVMSRGEIEKLPPGVALGRDPAGALAALRARVAGGDIWLYGGGTIAGVFLDAGLIDRVEITTVPVVLGAGRSLFAGASHAHTLILRESGALGSAVTSIYTKSL